jgi:hypothetical protein
MSAAVAALDHLVLTVADLARTCDFYMRALGTKAVRFGEGRVALNFGQQKINLHQSASARSTSAIPTAISSSSRRRSRRPRSRPRHNCAPALFPLAHE